MYNGIKIGVAVGINILFAHLIIYTLGDPNSAFVKDHQGNFIEPDTFIMRLACALFAFFIYALSLIYIIYKSHATKVKDK